MEQLVILPGLMCDSRMFAAQTAAFDAHVIDGFYGNADRIEAMVDYALARMPDRVALLGHSMGARVAIHIASRAPERVARLALADTGIHPPRAGEGTRRHALRDLGRRDGIAALIDAWLPPMVGRAALADATLMAMLRAMAIDAGIDVFARQIEALLHRPDAAAQLADITCPAIAIVGDEDTWSPVAQHEAIVEALPGAQLHVVPNAGHMAPAEAPAAFNAIVARWLESPARAPSSHLSPNVNTARGCPA